MLQTVPLGDRWPTVDPFLFCAHHRDDYPTGSDDLGPSTSLAGRELGMDFAGVDGWNMYHGRRVPGFPQHPHRGFETITFVRRGIVDHSDSLGAAAPVRSRRRPVDDRRIRDRPQRDVPAARPERPQSAPSLPDLAQPARRRQVGRPVLHDVLGRRHTGEGVGRGRGDRDRRRARRPRPADASARLLGRPGGERCRALARRAGGRGHRRAPAGPATGLAAHGVPLRGVGSTGGRHAPGGRHRRGGTPRPVSATHRAGRARGVSPDAGPPSPGARCPVRGRS